MTYGGLHSPSLLKKSTDAYLSYRTPNPSGPVESTPVVWNGKIHTITCDSISGVYQNTLRIDTQLERPLTRISIPDMKYICAIVEGSRCYIFGSHSTHKQIRMIYSDDMVNWSAPVTVLTDSLGMGFYNTSVAKTPAGFVMAVEVTDPAFPNLPFVTRFLASTDLLTWAIVPGALFNNNVFTNCPAIRYVDGKYYLLYMSSANGGMITFISRSSDLVSWQHSAGGSDGLTVPFCPLSFEGNNNSDVDLCEYNGSTYFTYARGDQTSWLELCTAVYPATMEAYLKSFF